MVAPNGARKVKADHPLVPLDAGEIAAVARDCADAGAGAIHYHVRDAEGGHILDAGLYHEATAELQRAVPDMHLQITTETVGRYHPNDMRDIVRAIVPQGASVGVINKKIRSKEQVSNWLINPLTRSIANRE